MAQSTNEGIRVELLSVLEAEAPNHDIDIVEVEVVGSTKSPTVRVRIDHTDEEADPISLDEVSEHTGWISDLIDEADPIEGSYTLEVSSPGLARPLRRPHDFERFAGQTVSLSLDVAEGRRRYTGVLEGLDEAQNVRITCDEGPFEFPLSSIKTCKIKPSFEAAAKPRGKR